MNDEQFAALEAEEKSLWQIYKAAEDATKPQRDIWVVARKRLDRERLRREILAEQPALNSERVEGRV